MGDLSLSPLVLPWPAKAPAWEGPNGNSPISAAGSRGAGLPDCHSDGVLDKQVMFTQQILQFLHVMSNRRYMAASEGGKGGLTWCGITLTFRLTPPLHPPILSLLPVSFSFCLTVSHSGSAPTARAHVKYLNAVVCWWCFGTSRCLDFDCLWNEC